MCPMRHNECLLTQKPVTQCRVTSATDFRKSERFWGLRPCLLFVFVTLAPAFVVSLRAPWLRIAVRVEGNWITAGGHYAYEICRVPVAIQVAGDRLCWFARVGIRCQLIIITP